MPPKARSGAPRIYCSEKCRKRKSRASPLEQRAIVKKRYPIDPLFKAMLMTPNAAAELLKLSGSTYQDYRARGVTIDTGERLASRVGFHFTEIWPEMMDDIIEAETIPCPGCGTGFIPLYVDQRYCEPRCANTAGVRRRRAKKNPGALATKDPRPCPGCQNWFVPRRSNKQKFCTTQCGNSTAKRTKYQNDPEYRDRVTAQRREAWLRDQDYERRRQAAYNRRKRTPMKTITPEYVTDRLTAELEIPGVTVAPMLTDSWAALDMGPRARAIGLHIVVGEAVSEDPDDGHEVTVFFSPDQIAGSVLTLPVSPTPDDDLLYVDVDAPAAAPDPNGLANDVACIMFADNYVRILATEALTVIANAELEEEDRRKAVDEAIIGLHPTANRMATTIEFAALDA